MKTPLLAALPNGVRVVALPDPHAHTAAVAVFVRSGSAHERRADNGISHLVEHMAFKGTETRTARRINVDAEALGAEVNAHTDKDHTAFHMRGLPSHAGDFVRMLGDIVCASVFPADELERERAVVLQEFGEDEDDPLSTAFKLFDRACFGLHPAAQPVIGERRNVERFTREDLARYVRTQYTGANVVVGAAGAVDVDAVVRAAQASFGALPRGEPNAVAPPAYAGGIRSRTISGIGQTHLVLGFPLPVLAADDAAGEVAAAVLGEGMSSPLMDRVRERLGLVYYAACSADVLDVSGQFVIEASTSVEQLDTLLREVAALLVAHAAGVDSGDLQRARHQIAVRRLRALERPLKRLEDAALDLFVHGRVRAHDERLDALHAVDRERVRAAFQRMLAAGTSAALAGKLPRGAGARAREVLAAAGLPCG
jgi:predicted Zn-dependent peptidase